MIGGCFDEDRGSGLSFSGVVDNSNSPPVIAGRPRTKIAIGQSYNFAPSATDPDGQSLATLPDPWASPLGWGAYGLYYTVDRANPPNTLELWLWDGQNTRQIHTLRDDHGYMTVVAGGFHARQAS